MLIIYSHILKKFVLFVNLGFNIYIYIYIYIYIIDNM